MLDYFHGMIVFRFVDFLIAWKFYKHLAGEGNGVTTPLEGGFHCARTVTFVPIRDSFPIFAHTRLVASARRAHCEQSRPEKYPHLNISSLENYLNLSFFSIYVIRPLDDKKGSFLLRAISTHRFGKRRKEKKEEKLSIRYTIPSLSR